MIQLHVGKRTDMNADGVTAYVARPYVPSRARRRTRLGTYGLGTYACTPSAFMTLRLLTCRCIMKADGFYCLAGVVDARPGGSKDALHA